MKALVYSANTATQIVPLNGTINFGSIVRKSGCGVSVVGGNLVASEGYLNVTANITITATNAGTATVTLYKDGIPITGANASATLAVGDVATLVIPCVVRQKCCCESTITAVLSGTEETVTSASIIGERV